MHNYVFTFIFITVVILLDRYYLIFFFKKHTCLAVSTSDAKQNMHYSRNIPTLKKYNKNKIVHNVTLNKRDSADYYTI